MGNDISIRDAATIVNANLNAQISFVTCIVWVVIILCLENPMLQVVACISWLCEVIYCIREKAKVRYLVRKINGCEEGQ